MSTSSKTYNKAHHLTDIVDGVGNANHEAVDTMRNHIKGKVMDASGTLVGQVARAAGALSRTQNLESVVKRGRQKLALSVESGNGGTARRFWRTILILVYVVVAFSALQRTAFADTQLRPLVEGYHTWTYEDRYYRNAQDLGEYYCSKSSAVVDHVQFLDGYASYFPKPFNLWCRIPSENNRVFGPAWFGWAQRCQNWRDSVEYDSTGSYLVGCWGSTGKPPRPSCTKKEVAQNAVGDPIDMTAAETTLESPPLL